jgi:hypothetical protein
MIEKVLSFLNNIPDDKVRHSYMGMVIFTLTCLFAPTSYAFVLLVLIALGKEVYDYIHPNIHTCDKWDFVATVFGALPVIILMGVR